MVERFFRDLTDQRPSLPQDTAHRSPNVTQVPNYSQRVRFMRDPFWVRGGIAIVAGWHAIDAAQPPNARRGESELQKMAFAHGL